MGGKKPRFPRREREKKKIIIIIIEDQEGAGEAERESGAGEGASEAGAVGTPAGCEAFRRRGRNPRRAGGSRGKGGGAAPGRQPRPSVRPSVQVGLVFCSQAPSSAGLGGGVCDGFPKLRQRGGKGFQHQHLHRQPLRLKRVGPSWYPCTEFKLAYPKESKEFKHPYLAIPQPKD